MATTIVAPAHARAAAAAEYRDIHAATCRYRRQDLVCSACTELVERAERIARRSATAESEAA